MHRIGPLEIGEDIVGSAFRQVLGHHHEAFQGGLGIARIGDGQIDRMLGRNERRVGIAILEVAHRHQVGPGRLVDQGGAVHCRRLGVDRGRQRIVRDLDVFEGVLRLVAVLGHDQDHRLADETYPIHGQGPLVEGQLEDHDEGISELLDVLAGEDGDHAGPLQGRRGVDGNDLGVGVRRAQDGAVQRAGPHRHVVGVAPATSQQGGVFHPLQGLADVFFRLGLPLHRRVPRCQWRLVDTAAL